MKDLTAVSMSRKVEVDTIFMALPNSIRLVVKYNRKVTLIAIRKQRIEPRTTQVLSVVTADNFDSVQGLCHTVG